MINAFGGVITAMITPFKEGGVNFNALERLIEFQIDGGADALVVLGTTGEPSVMTDREKEATVRFAVKCAGGRIKIIVGTGSNDTSKAVAASIRAESFGADGVLAVTPYYNKCTQSGICGYYRAVCSAVHLPVIAYNVPSRTGVNILPETAEKISRIPNLAGIKEASGNMAQACETMRRIRGRCDLYSGEDGLNVPTLAVGGAGIISVVSNIAPMQVKEVYESITDGNFRKANKIQDKLLPLIGACFSEVNPIPVKEALNILGFGAGLPRPPLTPLEEKNKVRLLREMKRAGLING